MAHDTRNVSSPDDEATLVRTMDRDTSIGVAVMDVVAELIDEDARPLEPLAHYVDPDALDALFATDATVDGTRWGRVSFSYERFDVTLEFEDQVTIYVTDRWDAT